MKLLSIGSDAKTPKGEKLGYRTAILYLAPHTQAGVGNLCPHASAGCAAACLYTAGRGTMPSVQAGRLRKTREFAADPKGFVERLSAEVAAFVRRCEKGGMKPAVRLNGTSDLPWENLGGERGVNLMERFPSVRFYDYTKSARRALASARGDMPNGYKIVFSRAEDNAADCGRVLRAGGSVAAVFAVRRGADLPEGFSGFRVVDGDAHDLRFLDPPNVVVGLRAKGAASKDDSGFVIAA